VKQAQVILPLQYERERDTELERATRLVKEHDTILSANAQRVMHTSDDGSDSEQLDFELDEANAFVGAVAPPVADVA